MKLVRIAFYIFTGLFLLLFAAGIIIDSLFADSPKEFEKRYAGQDQKPVYSSYAWNGRTVGTVAIGPDTAQRIIFVHGSPGSWNNFAVYFGFSDLYETSRLIAIDRPGYGRSGPGEGLLTLEDQVAAILPLAVASPGGKKPLLVGHSLGGPIVMRAAMMYPDRWGGVISIAGSFDADLEFREWYRPLYKIFPVNLLITPAFKSSNNELFPHKHQLYAMAAEWDRITCPVTVIQGDKDILVLRGNADFAEKHLVNAVRKTIVRVPGANHFIPWEQPEIVKKAIFDMKLQ